MAKNVQSMDDPFKGRSFERELIVLSVRWSLRVKSSLRDLVEMRADRGVGDGAHAGHALGAALRVRVRGAWESSRSQGRSIWRVDETAVKSFFCDRAAVPIAEVVLLHRIRK